MPVQINGVIIRAIVDPLPSGSSGSQNAPVTTNDADLELVEKVLEIIKDKKER
jgi:hypothetical protein